MIVWSYITLVFLKSIWDIPSSKCLGKKIELVLNFIVIAAIFTLGTWVNRKDVPWYDDIRAPLLIPSDTHTRENPLEANTSVPAERDSEIPSKKRRRNIQTRILARFPFFLEILYWLLIYWIYQGARAISARIIAGHDDIFEKAEHHAIQVLLLEHLIHIDIELRVQQFVLRKVPWLMKALAQIYYSHIVLGSTAIHSFSRTQYKRIRRTLALENILAFILLSLWRCAPPRLLPEEFGFIDVLHDSRSGSAWTQNKFQLTIAAMPSLHFGNSVLIALCLGRFSPHMVLSCVVLVWPILMGVTVVATANHFVLDMVVGVIVIAVAYWLNRGMLTLKPLESMLFRFCRLEVEAEIGES
ncbi:uncharacterized protein N7469_009297 [Penicillium citrinum]|uniref:Inositolphosphotransferase Aur1/Ipt1 domain-containing protein n=1 Tax=Penicillium citrinum TaxID=5077 RepID=A0A9W9NN53_PENCI|nr:uncharacterized protein N7469_009297 [Penicillium citrinum]KAJ5223057.1 hypothetical protein N7469_009297 [Penicillium citrinum]